MTKTGLTLGKFAPFHKGHQFLLETALTEMDRVVVIIYNADEVTPIPLSVRANWIRDLYPQIRVIEAQDGPQCVGDSPEIKKLHESYLLDTLNIKNITHFYSGEFYGDHVSRALNAKNRQVDPGRSTVNISGTRIRKNPFQYKSFLSPRVYRDLVTNVVFLGAPSTGKTTLAQSLSQMYKTQWMPEYGREYWEFHQKNRRLSPAQLLDIARGHLDREEPLLLDSDRYLFTDTNALTTRLFSLYYHGRVHPELDHLACVAEKRYHQVFVCDTDIPYENTWDRSGDVMRHTFQQAVIQDLTERHIPYTILSGNLNQRINTVRKHIE